MNLVHRIVKLIAVAKLIDDPRTRLAILRYNCNDRRSSEGHVSIIAKLIHLSHPTRIL